MRSSRATVGGPLQRAANRRQLLLARLRRRGWDGLTQLLNQAITSHASADGAIVADAFSTFQQAAAYAAGHTCAAGLLNASPQNQLTCDVHPSQSGQQLLAQAVYWRRRRPAARRPVCLAPIAVHRSTAFPSMALGAR
jgi:lysophospholipase L1-like esterase